MGDCSFKRKYAVVTMLKYSWCVTFTLMTSFSFHLMVAHVLWQAVPKNLIGWSPPPIADHSWLLLFLLYWQIYSFACPPLAKIAVSVPSNSSCDWTSTATAALYLWIKQPEDAIDTSKAQFMWRYWTRAHALFSVAYLDCTVHSMWHPRHYAIASTLKTGTIPSS